MSRYIRGTTEKAVFEVNNITGIYTWVDQEYMKRVYRWMGIVKK